MDGTASLRITAVLPARNEEDTIETAVRSLAAQPEIAEIRVVNDASSDRTREILVRLAAELPHVRLLEAPLLPFGWVGKNHAAWFGAQGASTDWLLFTDADVRHLPGAAARALELAASTGAALVSFSPRQRMETWCERALIPFVYVRLAARYSYDSVNDPESPIAAANGQYLLIRRDVYLAVGGHGSVANEVVEDVALARQVKAHGHRLHFRSGAAFVETRMYRSFRAMWHGWNKNLYPLMGGTRGAVARELLEVVPVAAIAFMALGIFFPAMLAVSAGLLLVRALLYLVKLQAHRFPVRCILYWGPGLVLYSAALIVSAYHYSAGSVAWKGRTYPVRPQSEAQSER